jgi:trehalose 6-phosphate phosphatase
MPMLMECETRDAGASFTEQEERLDAFLASVAVADQSVLLLDFDGTLAPFRIDPAKVKPWAGVVKLLDDIQETTRTRLAIISGRPATDVASALGMAKPPEIWGSHGAERLLRDGRIELDELLPHQGVALTAAKRALHEAGVFNAPGLRLEEKWNAAAVHWRGKSQTSAGLARQRISEVLSPFAREAGMTLLQFDGGVELRAGRNKGIAVRSLLAEVPSAAPVAYLGDDVTDEDAFRALAGKGLGILVRRERRPSAAQIWLRPPGQLREFLSGWLVALRR